MAKKVRRDALKILFPEETVDIGDGVQVTIRPFPVSVLPKVTAAFRRILSSVQNGGQPQDMVFVCIDEIMEILRYCIDKDLEEIPASAFPDLAQKFIEQNVSDDVVGKWISLFESVATIPGLTTEESGNEQAGS